MLVRDTLWSCKDYLTAAQREDTAEHRAQTYHSLVICDKLRSEVLDYREGDEGSFTAGRPV